MYNVKLYKDSKHVHCIPGVHNWTPTPTFKLDNNLQIWSERLGGIYHVSDITIYLEASEKVFLNLYKKQQLYHFVKA